MIRLAVRVRREQSELVLAELLELAPSGVEEVAISSELVEYAVYGAPGELPALPDLRAAAGGALIEVTTAELADDWAERWREFHKPLVLDGRLTVRPPWAPAGETEIDVVIDPAQAFGTGAHATTRLCLELLLELEQRGPFLDLGCGSGVLAIVAAQLGFSPVLACDYDQAAIEATRTNATFNDVAIDVARLDLRTDPIPPAQTVAANLLAPLLLELAPRLVADGPERLLASGILDGEADNVAAAFGRVGLHARSRRSRDGWTAFSLQRQG